MQGGPASLPAAEILFSAAAGPSPAPEGRWLLGCSDCVSIPHVPPGLCQLCEPSASHHPSLASHLWPWWQQYLPHIVASKLRRMLPVESLFHCQAFGPAAMSVLFPPSFSPQHSSPSLPAHGCGILGLLMVPGSRARAVAMPIYPWKH